MKQKDRYLINYQEAATGKWKEVSARTKPEAQELYDMIGSEAICKVLYDTVNGNVLKQSF